MKDVKNIIKKFEVLNQINHPCICTAYYINTQETVKDANIDDSKNTTIAIFLEFLEFDLKKQLQNGMNNTLKTRIVVEISHALNYLHQKGMIHRDLKIEKYNAQFSLSSWSILDSFEFTSVCLTILT